MAEKTVIKERLTYYKGLYAVQQKAYIDLMEGRVRSYMIEDRQISYLNVNDVLNAMKETEKTIDQYEAMLNGKSARKAFGVIPRDW